MGVDQIRNPNAPEPRSQTTRPTAPFKRGPGAVDYAQAVPSCECGRLAISGTCAYCRGAGEQDSHRVDRVEGVLATHQPNYTGTRCICGGWSTSSDDTYQRHLATAIVGGRGGVNVYLRWVSHPSPNEHGNGSNTTDATRRSVLLGGYRIVDPDEGQRAQMAGYSEGAVLIETPDGHRYVLSVVVR